MATFGISLSDSFDQVLMKQMDVCNDDDQGYSKKTANVFQFTMYGKKIINK
jgi:hypothetical protein